MKFKANQNPSAFDWDNQQNGMSSMSGCRALWLGLESLGEERSLSKKKERSFIFDISWKWLDSIDLVFHQQISIRVETKWHKNRYFRIIIWEKIVRQKINPRINVSNNKP